MKSRLAVTRYHETYLGAATPGISSTAQASGASHVTLAFIQSADSNTCVTQRDWDFGHMLEPFTGA